MSISKYSAVTKQGDACDISWNHVSKDYHLKEVMWFTERNVWFEEKNI